MAYTPWVDKTFSVRYRLVSAPQPRTDGSGSVDWDVWSQTSQDAGVTWVDDAHWTVSTPGRDLETVLLMADTTGAQKTAKNAAAKTLLVANRSTQPVPIVGQSQEQIGARNNANGLSASAAAGINTYITVTINQTYPLAFNL